MSVIVAPRREPLLEVLEDVPGVLLALRVASRSRTAPSRVVTVEWDVEGRLSRVACDCPAGRFRQGCHHIKSLLDLAGGDP